MLWPRPQVGAGAMVLQLTTQGVLAMNQTATKSSQLLLSEWVRIAKANRSIRRACDPWFGPNSFTHCATLDELRGQLDHGNWATGVAFTYRDICFINQIDGGDEWLTIRHGIPFESITWRPVIARGGFDELMSRLLAATPEQCRSLRY